MSINPTNAPADVIKFYENAKKAFIGKSIWIIDHLQQRTSNGIIDRTVVTICDEEGFCSGTLQSGGNIRQVGAFNGAFNSVIDDVRFSEWKKGVYRFWLWNDTQREIVEFYYHCDEN